MSYDLFFLTRQDGPTDSSLLAYFSNRPRDQVGENQAFYSNEDTGVYFSWDVGLEEVEES
ncbi:MAG: hypothetical protein JXQ27_19220 [Acidobacteria bacterium]|nr:hypothetical protein [Acidobacteriota bacterium]